MKLSSLFIAAFFAALAFGQQPISSEAEELPCTMKPQQQIVNGRVTYCVECDVPLALRATNLAAKSPTFSTGYAPREYAISLLYPEKIAGQTPLFAPIDFSLQVFKGGKWIDQGDGVVSPTQHDLLLITATQAAPLHFKLVAKIYGLAHPERVQADLAEIAVQVWEYQNPQCAAPGSIAYDPACDTLLAVQ